MVERTPEISDECETIRGYLERGWDYFKDHGDEEGDLFDKWLIRLDEYTEKCGIIGETDETRVNDTALGTGTDAPVQHDGGVGISVHGTPEGA